MNVARNGCGSKTRNSNMEPNGQKPVCHLPHLAGGFPFTLNSTPRNLRFDSMLTLMLISSRFMNMGLVFGPSKGGLITKPTDTPMNRLGFIKKEVARLWKEHSPLPGATAETVERGQLLAPAGRDSVVVRRRICAPPTFRLWVFPLISDAKSMAVSAKTSLGGWVWCQEAIAGKLKVDYSEAWLPSRAQVFPSSHKLLLQCGNLQGAPLVPVPYGAATAPQ